MAQILFYGKMNCINNNKQKSLLKAAGHVVEEHDILKHPWTAEDLRSYFEGMPVSEWFNKTAPAIKNGELAIEEFSEPQALEAMLRDPLLIRRPLMDIGDRKICGFRYDELDMFIGLSPAIGHEVEMAALRSTNMTTCPFLDGNENCDTQEKQ